MTFREALIAVQSEFRTQYVAPDAYAIRVNRSFNGSELYYIELCDEEGVPMLTDNGETQRFFFRVTEEEWDTLCREHRFEYRNGRIRHPFAGLDDLYAYIDLLLLITDRYTESEG